GASAPPGPNPRFAARHLRRALPRRRAGDGGTSRRALSRLAAQREGARNFCAPPRHRACAAPVLCRATARHPDHPRVRGARLRHPAGLRPVAGFGEPVPPRRGLPGRARRRRDGAPSRGDPRRRGSARGADRERARDHPGAPHLRASRRRTPRHSRDPEGGRAAGDVRV
ncbi:MAG: Spore_germination_protein_CgeB, partial [uncultured Microvirga sp.]